MKNNQVRLKQTKQVSIFLEKIKVVQRIRNDCSLEQMENPVGKTIAFLICCSLGLSFAKNLGRRKGKTVRKPKAFKQKPHNFKH